MSKKDNIDANEYLDVIGNEYATIAADGTFSDVDGFLDTGCYILNALYSGSIYGGLPSNKINGLAGVEATGKSYVALGIVKHFLDNEPTGLVFYFESEGSLTKSVLTEREIDTKRFLLIPIETIQQFKNQALKIVEKHLEKEEKTRKKILIVLDSLGMLSTSKEMEDSVEGKETKDMTRTQIIKAAFRVLTLKLSKAKIPMIVTNHVYDSMGSMFPTKEISGGSGLKYAANNIIMLSKRKEKDNSGDIIGNIIHCKNYKSRLTVENKVVDVLLRYDRGLDKYYGLIEVAIKHNIFEKVGNKIKLPDGTLVFESKIIKSPEMFYTKEILDRLEKACQIEFKYGSITLDEEESTDE